MTKEINIDGVGEVKFDLSNSTALLLESKAKLFFGDLSAFLFSSMFLDFTLWVASIKAGHTWDFDEAVLAFEKANEKELNQIGYECRGVVDFLILGATRRLSLPKQEIQDIRTALLTVFTALQDTVVVS